MRTTKTTITCDKCGSTFSSEHWTESKRKFKGTINFDPQVILGGDYCVSCTERFNSLHLEAHDKWLN